MQLRARALDRREKAIIITIGANLLLVALKFFLSSVSGSIALKASAWHSIGDVFSSLLVMGGFVAARFLSGKKEKYAAYVENAVAFAIAILIFYMAFDIFREAVSGGEAPNLRNAWPVTIGSLLTIGITYFTARYKEYVGKSTDSLSLVASGYHSRIDLYASVLVLVSLASSALGLGALDRFAAFVVCLLVAVSGWEIAAPAARGLFTTYSRKSPAGVPGREGHLSISGIAMVGLSAFVAFGLLSGFAAVYPDERAIISRFGRIVREVGPGLSYHFPYVEGIRKVSVSEVRKTGTGTQLVLSGDTNLIDVDMAIQYRIIDPGRFLFGSQQPSSIVSQYAETAMREIVAKRSVDDLLVGSRAEIASSIRARAQELVEAVDIGVLIDSVQLVSVNPPSEVAEAFRDVASAREDKNTYISEALAYKNEVVPIARGEAVKATLSSEAERRRKTDVSEGVADRFAQKSLAFRSGSSVTRTRLYLEAMEKALPKAKKYIVDPRVVANPTQLWVSKGAMTLPSP